MRKYQVEQANVVVFDIGGRSKYVSAKDIVEYDYSNMQAGQPPTKIAFKGEQAFSSAIQSVIEAKRPAVYFLQGHGERDVENFGRSGGFSSIAQEIRRDNIDVKTLTLGEKQTVPDDCSVLIIAGPTKALSDPELTIIRRYIEQKGRALVMLDSATKTGLEPLLTEWGVRVGDDVVVDATRTLSGRELFVTKYEAHPITAKMNGVTSIFYLPRSVEPATEADESGSTADKPHAVPLASSSESGWAEVDLNENPMKYDPERDRPGPVSIAVAVEKGPVPGIDVQIRPTRLVVIGDSDFVANGAMTGGNADFFLNSLNWLLEREEMLGIAPKPVELNRLMMSRAQIQSLFWVVVFIWPGCIALLSALVWLRRRS